MSTASSPPYPNPELNRFDAPVRKSLESHVRRLRQDPTILEPVISAAIDEAKKTITRAPPISSLLLQLKALESHAVGYVDAVLAQSNKWLGLRSRILAYSSVFVAGAGVSFGSEMPLSNILTDLVTFCQARDWREIAGSPAKCLIFKNEFKRISDGKKPSLSHCLVVANFPNRVLEIICLNWDDLFERAAQAVGKLLNTENQDRPVTTGRHLWKFHGDVSNIQPSNIPGQGGWIWPDEQGYVFPSFVTYLQNSGLKTQMFTLVVLGYAEHEEEISNLISLLEQNPPRPTFRIGLDIARLHDDRYIVGPSDYVLGTILPRRP